MQPDATNTARRVNSFFAGIGGFDLAFEKHGFEPSFYCEKDDFCRSVLKRNWPKVANASDIQKLDAKDVPQADVWKLAQQGGNRRHRPLRAARGIADQQPSRRTPVGLGPQEVAQPRRLPNLDAWRSLAAGSAVALR